MDTSESNFAYVGKTEASVTVPTNVKVKSAVFIQPCLDLFGLIQADCLKASKYARSSVWQINDHDGNFI